MTPRASIVAMATAMAWLDSMMATRVVEMRLDLLPVVKVEMLQLAKQDAWQRGGTRLSRFMARWQKRVGLQS